MKPRTHVDASFLPGDPVPGGSPPATPLACGPAAGGPDEPVQPPKPERPPEGPAPPEVRPNPTEPELEPPSTGPEVEPTRPRPEVKPTDPSPRPNQPGRGGTRPA